jgi:spore germination cell wall hydrolase CwlJ-like protein
MQPATVLDLGMYRQLPEREAVGFVKTTLFGAVGLMAVAGASAIGSSSAFGDALSALGLKRPAVVMPGQRLSLDQLKAVEVMSVDDKSQLLANGLDAQQRNAAIPLAGMPLEAVGRFNLGAAPNTYANALQCLTQAVYYEAANEPMQGRRAVAQVVLNRMRHPAYPNSVCGVVYQGSQRRTGCQFSFTCDGSLLRTPAAARWREARQVAELALVGYVEPSVGTATHYHADYVLPRWAFNLAKIDQIGRHIFYRFNGRMGQASYFSGRYSGHEDIPSLDRAALEQRLAADGELLAPIESQFVPGLTVTHDVTDRHATTDVGGRLDTTKEWRLNIPDPVAASSRYRESLGGDALPLPSPVPTASPASGGTGNAIESGQ